MARNGSVRAQEFFFQLGNRNPEGGFGKPKPPFYARQAFVLLAAAYPDAEDKLAADDAEFGQWKAKYDRSKRTTTRTGATPVVDPATGPGFLLGRWSAVQPPLTRFIRIIAAITVRPGCLRSSSHPHDLP